MTEQNSVLKQVGLMVLSAVVLIGLIYLVAMAGNQGSSQSDDNKSVSQVAENDWTIGNADAPVTIIEYGDYQCPACASYHPLVKEILDGYSDDQVQFAYRHFPLTQIHRNAMPASMAAEAAGRQGKFWEMHNMLYENQNTWNNSGNADEIFIEFARGLGLDEEKFRQDSGASELRTKILEQYQSGTQAGVNSTPSFFVNGEKISNPRSSEEFRSIIDGHLN